MSDTITIKNDGEEQEVTLADIAGVDLAGVEEFDGFEATPKGLYDWEVKDAGLDTVETKDGTKGIIYFELECLNVHSTTSEDAPEKLIGMKHRETIFISDAAKALGQAKAIMTKSGFIGSGSLETLLDAFCGHKFTAPIKQRRDKNDADVVYSNIIVKKIVPIATAGSLGIAS